MEKLFHANGNKKKTRVAIFILEKIDFKTRSVTKDKEGYYIMIKESIQEKDLTFVHINAPT